MIHVIAAIDVVPGRLDEFLQIFHQLVPKVREEEGCLEYGPAMDLSTSIPGQQTRENTVTIIEKWSSIEALEKHLMAPHMGEFRRATEGIRVGLSLQILKPV
ncbi:MAG: putative quinol monooxygenase [Planctomycetota bacterium]